MSLDIIDTVKQNQRHLENLRKRSTKALNVVTSTINKLSDINEQIDGTVKEIKETKDQLQATEDELLTTKDNNAKIIEKFKNLIEV